MAISVMVLASPAAADGRVGTVNVANPAIAKVALAPGLFGTHEVRSANLKPFKKWAAVLKRYRGERHLETQACTSGPCPLRHWQNFLAGLRDRAARFQINAVNRYANAMRYISDRHNNGTADYWATPKEFFGRGGDCEDYAIAKYLSLRALGFDAKEMRIVVLKDTNRGIAHAVLMVHHQGRNLILDNQIKVAVAAEKIRHYRPYYSINESYWWHHRAPSGEPRQATVAAGRSVG